MPLTPLNLLAAIISPLRTSHLGGLDRLTINAHGTGRGCAPRSHTGPLAQDLDHLGPCPIIAPLDKVVIDSTPTATSRFDLRADTRYAPPAYPMDHQEAPYVTSLSDRRRRLCHSHV